MSMDPMHRIVLLFESFAPADLQRLQDYYREDARFKDPLHAVQGLEPIRDVYRHMFDAMDRPRFTVTRRFAQERECVLLWEFRFALRRFPGRGAVTMHGASHLRLDAQGRIAEHRDYWDAAEALYEHLPGLGGVMRWLKRRAAA
jgi:hypothetical protein